jgi:hypothetical protein
MPYRCNFRHISTRWLALFAGRLKTSSSHGAEGDLGVADISTNVIPVT